MKKFSLIILLVGILPLNACAQWYLFPGKKKQNTENNSKTSAQKDTIETKIEDLAINEIIEQEVDEYYNEINITLALPFEAKSSKPNANFLEMYSGALIALEELGKDGFKYRLNVIDTKDEAADYSFIEDSQLIIGPISYNEILRTLPLCSKNQTIVSPLDPKTFELSKSNSVIQSPTSQSYQIEDMIKWIDEDLQPGEHLLVAKDNSENEIIALLNSRSIPYKIVSNFTNYRFENGVTYRVVIASDNDAFYTGITRNLAIEAERNPKSTIILYCNSRIRSSISQNVDDLYKVRARMTAGYHIDYDSALVKAFVLKYRSLFHSEPGSFAFQGYDAMKYYIFACQMGGSRWSKKLIHYPQKGLQSDFKFIETENEGRTNVAVRRIIYNPDLTTTLL